MPAAALPSGENISCLLKAAGVEVEAYWPSLFAKLCKGKNIGDMLSAVGSAPAAGGGGGGGGDAAAAAPAAGAVAGGAAPAAKAPEPEPEEEEEEEVAFDLFGAPRHSTFPCKAYLTSEKALLSIHWLLWR
jgi:large subunit ribosomal protein LP1